MDAARWQRIQDLFDAALDLPRAEREAFLNQKAGGDRALVAELRSLLAADTTGHSLLDGLAVDAVSLEDTIELGELIGRGPTVMPGDRVGPYQILERIATGGMGSVFLADRADGQFEQQVALKLIRSGYASDALLHRFQRERQILARLQHPGIARLLDGGLSENGQPYFVMEYVAGRPLTTYCDQRRLTVAERLQLFVKVGRAVQYAHRNLVVHRDLKPSNILVTDEAQIKLLDFGIAKVMTDGPAAVDALPVTRTGVRVMTPEYASPEQIRGEAITTATDVYALGVLLYELLTGRRPHERARRWEIEQAVLHDEPLKPSTAVRQAGEGGDTKALALVGETRATSIDYLARRLRGDLDTICRKALEKRPDDRYDSVEQFVEDVQRHLAGLPIVARQPTAEYRLRKFVQRHRTGVAATAVVTVLIASLVTFYTVQLAAERDRAQQEAAKAQQVAAFLTELFEASDPSENLGETLTARELLDRGAARIDTALTDQPAVRTELLHTIGEVNSTLGDMASAQTLLEEALALSRATHGADDLATVKTMDALAWVLWQVGDLDAAEALYRDALRIRQRDLDPAHPDVGTSLQNLAHLFYQRGDLAAAEPLYRDALRVQTAARGDDHLFVAGIQENYAQTLQFLGRYEEADSLISRAVATRRAQQGPAHPELATSLHNLATLRSEMQQTESAIALFREALAMAQQVVGPEHPDVGAVLSVLAWTLYQNGDYEAADTTYRASVRINRQIWGDDHFNVGYDLQNWAKLRQSQQRDAEADSLYALALTIYRAALPADNPHRASLIYGLGLLRTQQGQADAAEPLLREGLAVAEASLPADHWLTLSLQSALGAALSEQGRHAEAEPLLTGSHARLQDTRGDDDPYTLRSTEHLAAHYDATGRLDAAEALRSP